MPQVGDNLREFPHRVLLEDMSAEACVVSVMGAAEASDRSAASRRGRYAGFAAMPPKRRREARRKAQKQSHPRTYFGFTDHEFSVYGVLRAKHGMTREQAAAAVLRSRNSAPKPEAR